jgi:hypothetical protein
VKLHTPAIALLLTGSILLAIPASPAAASPEGRRNTAIGLGAVAVYGAVTKKPVVAGVAAAGAIYSYVKGRKESRERDRRVDYRRDRVGRYDPAYDREDRYDVSDRYGRPDRYDRPDIYDPADRGDRYDRRDDGRFDRYSDRDEEFLQRARYDGGRSTRGRDRDRGCNRR